MATTGRPALIASSTTRGERILARAEEEGVRTEIELREVVRERDEVDPIAEVSRPSSAGVSVDVPDPDEVQIIRLRRRELPDLHERVDALAQVARSRR